MSKYEKILEKMGNLSGFQYQTTSTREHIIRHFVKECETLRAIQKETSDTEEASRIQIIMDYLQLQVEKMWRDNEI